MDINNVDVIIGLDAITDYSKNFKDSSESLYEVLSYVDSDRDIMTLFDTVDDKIAFFSSGKSDLNGDNKDFLLFVSDNAVNILRFFESKYTQLYLDFEISDEVREIQGKSILIMSRSIVQLAGLSIESLEDEDNN